MNDYNLLLGCAYYPEDWDESEIPIDIAKMKDVGINTARIAEFAWRKMEPKEGDYNFEWLHKVIKALADNEIKTVIGTPTATPPIWLSQKYPDIFVLHDNGRRKKHGGRRHCCSNNPHYREYSFKIVEQMAKEFGSDSDIIGWQLDNEIYIEGTGCFCPYCESGFREYLKEKYGTVEALNEAWNLNVFSQAYDSFDEIPTPSDTWHNPHLKLEWLTFQGESHIDFIHRQAEIVKRYTDAPIGTDMMPINGVDHEKMTSKLDVVQFNHYNTKEDLWTSVFWFDYLRNLKDRPFWVTETSPNWNGGVKLIQTMKPEGFCRMNSWLPIALGGQANMYWLWRTHWAGHELIHGAVINTSGQPMHTTGEVEQVASEFEKAGPFIKSTKVCSEVALHFSSLNCKMFATQPVMDGLNYTQSLYGNIYKPLMQSGIRPDVIGVRHSLDNYKVLFSPYMLTLEEENLESRITDWVNNGGMWIVGPFSDMRRIDGTRYKNRLYGFIEKLTGVKGLYQIPDTEHCLNVNWQNGENFDNSTWVEVFEETENTLACVTDGYSSLIGKSVVFKKQVGKGSVIVLGTVPSNTEMKKIINIATKEQDIKVYCVSENVIAVSRIGETESGLIVMEIEGKSGTAYLDKCYTDVLSGKEYKGELPLNPYDIYILVER